MIRIVQIAALLGLLTGSPAVAESQREYRGTAEQRASCRPDVYRLCASEIPNVRAITACLRKNQSRLSAECATVFDSTSD